MRGFEIEGRRLLVVNAGGRIFILDGICTHEEADLSTGFLLETRVTCPLHLSQFDVTSGAVLNPPAAEALRVYNVKIADESIFVEIG
jgi:nitrite reductase/ring-hydroxylating ferredoxin subunit